MKVPLADSSLCDGDVCALVCAKRTKSGGACKRYIVGTISGWYFESPVMPGKLCDMRNQEWRCWQHTLVTAFGEEARDGR